MVFESEIAVALELITEFGQDVSIRRHTDVAPSVSGEPWDPGAPNATTTSEDFAAKGVFLPQEDVGLSGQGNRVVGNTRIHQNSQQVIVAASGLSIVPTARDQLIRGSEVWSIASVEYLNPNGENIIYTLLIQQ